MYLLIILLLEMPYHKDHKEDYCVQYSTLSLLVLYSGFPPDAIPAQERLYVPSEQLPSTSAAPSPRTPGRTPTYLFTSPTILGRDPVTTLSPHLLGHLDSEGPLDAMHLQTMEQVGWLY